MTPQDHSAFWHNYGLARPPKACGVSDGIQIQRADHAANEKRPEPHEGPGPVHWGGNAAVQEERERRSGRNPVRSRPPRRLSWNAKYLVQNDG